MTTKEPSETGRPWLTVRACALCGSAGVEENGDITARICPDELPFDDVRDYWRGFRKDQCFFTYSRCTGCGFLYCRSYFNEGALERLYGVMPDNTAGVDVGVVGRTQSEYMGLLASVSPISGTYLEIGPDIGLALEAARGMGSVKQAILVEPNESVHARLREAAQGITCDVVENIKTVAADDRATVAVLIHVLDHVLEPVDLLLQVRERLAVGGRILVVVHNEQSLLRRVLGVKWPPFTLQHPHLFSRTTLTKALSDSGFRLDLLKPTTNYFPLRHLAYMGSTLVGMPNRWLSAVPAWTIGLRLGNVIAVGTKL